MDDEWAGQRVKCPECRETVPVPGGINGPNQPSPPTKTASFSNQDESEPVGSYAEVPGQTDVGVTTNNTHAKAGFILALVSIFATGLAPIGGFVPVLAMVFSSIGLGTFSQKEHHNKWMACWGLGIGIVFLLMAIFYYPSR